MEDRINKLKSDIKTLEDALKLIDKSATGARFTLSNYIGILENELNKLVKGNKLKENKLAIDIARTNKIISLFKDVAYESIFSNTTSYTCTLYDYTKKIAGLINDFGKTNPICEVISINDIKIGDPIHINGKVRTILNMLDYTNEYGQHTNTTLVFDYGIKVDCSRGSTVTRVLRGDNNE